MPEDPQKELEQQAPATPPNDPPADDGNDGGNEGEENYGGFDPEDAIVQIASKHGWEPKDKYSGDRPWTPPDKFVDAQWEINDSLKNGRKRLEQTVDQLTRKIDQMSRRWDEMSQRDQEKTTSDLKAARKQAIEEGDVSKVEEIDEQLDRMRQGAAERDGESDLDPAVSDWMEQSDWYRPGGKGAPDEVQDVIELVEELNSQENYQRLSPKFRLAKIDKEIADYVEMRRPDLIGKYNFNGIKPAKDDAGRAKPKEDDDDVEGKSRRQISDVEGGVQSGGTKGKGKTYASLSEMEKKACDSQVAAIPNMTVEKWLENYNSKYGNE